MAAALVDTLGRRSTIIWSNLALSAFTALIGLRFLFHWPVSASAAALCLAMLSFSLGPGPLTFVVISEMLPLHLRAKVVSLSVFCNRVGSGTIALTFLSLKCAIGPAAAFGLYAAVGLVVTAFYYTSVVESTGVRNLARGASRPPPTHPVSSHLRAERRPLPRGGDRARARSPLGEVAALGRPTARTGTRQPLGRRGGAAAGRPGGDASAVRGGERLPPAPPGGGVLRPVGRRRDPDRGV